MDELPERDPIWVRVADALYFIDNPEAIAQIADRFDTGYGPAIRDAPNEAAREKAVDALYRYLSAGATPRKRWKLAKDEPERALEALLDLIEKEKNER